MVEDEEIKKAPGEFEEDLEEVEEIVKKILEEGEDEKDEEIVVEDSSINDWGMDERISTSLGQRMAVTSSADFDMRRNNLEDSLEDVEVKSSDTKPLEVYSSNSSTYMGAGGIVGGAAEVRSIDELNAEGDFAEIKNWDPVRKDSSDPKMYDLQSNATEADKVKQINKYSPLR